jgi:hypothetical protein
MHSILKDASATGSAKGRSTDDKSLFVETILTAIAPGSDSTEQIPSLVDTSNAIGLSKSTTRRKLKVATAKRNSLVANLDSVKWSRQSMKRKGFSKITNEKRAAVCDWVKNHPNVIHSPIANDTILIKVEGHDEKQRVGKLLLEIPVRELHCLMVAKAEVGGLAVARDDSERIIISDSMLRKIIKKDMPQVKKATDRHKQMCGCEVCIQCASHQKSLSAWRYRRLQKLEADAKDLPEDSQEQQQTRQYRQSFLTDSGELKHEKPRHAVKSIMCDALQCGYCHWNCVLRRCETCPTYILNPLESSIDPDHAASPSIRFHHYQYTTKCTTHGVLPLDAKTCGACEQT